MFLVAYSQMGINSGISLKSVGSLDLDHDSFNPTFVQKKSTNKIKSLAFSRGESDDVLTKLTTAADKAREHLETTDAKAGFTGAVANSDGAASDDKLAKLKESASKIKTEIGNTLTLVKGALPKRDATSNSSNNINFSYFLLPMIIALF